MALKKKMVQFEVIGQCVFHMAISMFRIHERKSHTILNSYTLFTH